MYFGVVESNSGKRFIKVIFELWKTFFGIAFYTLNTFRKMFFVSHFTLPKYNLENIF